MEWMQKNKKNLTIGIGVLLISLIIVLIILLIWLISLISKIYNTITKSLVGVWKLNDDFADKANFTYGMLVVKENKDNKNMMNKTYNASLIYINNDEIKISELFTFTVSKSDILFNSFKGKDNIIIDATLKYLNKKSIVLPDDVMKINLDLVNNRLILLDDKNMFGFFDRSKSLIAQDLDNETNDIVENDSSVL